MSKSGLDKLIEQVIAEKTVIDLTNRLPDSGQGNDEAEDVKNAFDLSDRAKVKRPEKTGDGEYNYSTPTVNKDLGFKGSTLSKDEIKYIAGLLDDDGAPVGNQRKGHFLTDDDFKKLFSNSDSTSVSVVQNLFTKVFKKGGTSGGANTKEVLGKLINLYVGSEMQKEKDSDYQELKAWMPAERAVLLAPVVQAAIKAVGDVPKEFGWGMFPNPMKGSEVAPGAKGEETVDRFQKVSNETVNLDPMLAGIFKEFEGGSINDRFKQLEDFAAIFKGSTTEAEIQAGLKTWMTKNNKNQFQLMNYAYALGMLADEAKKQSSSNAGAFLEGYLNYFIGAPSVGGLSAATDNIAKLLNGGDLVYTSAKFYTGGTKVPQDGANLAAEAQDRSVFYIIASKQAESGGAVKGASYDKIDFHIVEIMANKGNPSKKNPWGLSQVNLGPGLKPQNEPEKVPKGTGSDASKAMIKFGGKEPMFTIYTLPEELSKAVVENQQTFDNIFVKSVKDSTDTALKVVKSISKNLSGIQELDYKTKKLSGDVGANTAGQALLKNKTAIMNRFAQLQGDLKSGYDTIFAAVEEADDPVSESMSPLDGLIETIIKKKLLK